MTNPTNHDAQTASIQNTSSENEFHDDNYILGLISRMSPIFKDLFFTAMSIKYGYLKPANDAVYSFTRKKELSRRCKINADKVDDLAEHLKTFPQT